VPAVASVPSHHSGSEALESISDASGSLLLHVAEPSIIVFEAFRSASITAGRSPWPKDPDPEGCLSSYEDNLHGAGGGAEFKVASWVPNQGVRWRLRSLSCSSAGSLVGWHVTTSSCGIYVCTDPPDSSALLLGEASRGHGVDGSS